MFTLFILSVSHVNVVYFDHLHPHLKSFPLGERFPVDLEPISCEAFRSIWFDIFHSWFKCQLAQIRISSVGSLTWSIVLSTLIDVGPTQTVGGTLW